MTKFQGGIFDALCIKMTDKRIERPLTVLAHISGRASGIGL